MMERYWTYKNDLNLVSIDLEKAYDNMFTEILC